MQDGTMPYRINPLSRHWYTNREKKMMYAYRPLVALSLVMIVVAGCMSLEERLASSDLQVKRAAERELIATSRRQGWSEEDRIAAIKRITDESLLIEIAKTAVESNRTLPDGIAALAKIDGDDHLSIVATDAKDAKVRRAAFERIKGVDQKDAVCKVREARAKKESAAMFAQLDKLHMYSQERKKFVELLSKVDVSDKSNAKTLLVKYSTERYSDAKLDDVLKKILLHAAQSFNSAEDAWDMIHELGRDNNKGNVPVVIKELERNFVSDCAKTPTKVAEFVNNGTGTSSEVDRMGRTRTVKLSLHHRDEYMMVLAIREIRDDSALVSLAKSLPNGGIKKAVYESIKDPEMVVKAIIDITKEQCDYNYNGYFTGKNDERNLFNRIDEYPDLLVKVASSARTPEIKTVALDALDDQKTIGELLSNGLVVDECCLLALIKNLKDGTATETMYQVTKPSKAREALFLKLPEAERAKVRSKDKELVEKLIASAKDKSKETFELGGFYLGMDIKDADKLIGYYFPEWACVEKTVDRKEIREFFVPQQSSPLCRAGKEGKVYELNFGRQILKLWYKYDVQDYNEWADAYAKQYGISMNYRAIEKEVDSLSYFHQQAWQYKNNVKNYRITYFGKKDKASGKIYNEQSIGDAFVAAMDNAQFADSVRFISSDEGTLRVAVDNN